MFNRTTSTNLSRPAKQNPKSEYRNPKQPKDLNPNYEIRNELVWNFLIFDHLKLFRISDFEFRICSFVYTWRPLRFGGMFCAFLRVIVFPIPYSKIQPR